MQVFFKKLFRVLSIAYFKEFGEVCMLKKIIQRLLLVAPFFYMIFIWILSSLPHDAILDTPFSFDRALKESLHLIEFGILYGLFVIFLAVLGRLNPQTSRMVAAISIAYGAIDEIHQAFVPYQSATVIDFVKDTIGVLVVYWIVKRVYFSDRPSKLKTFLQWIGQK